MAHTLLHIPAASMSEYLFLCLSSRFLLLKLFRLTLDPFSQPLEFLKKSAPVPSDAAVDPAECRPASCPAAGDRQGKPRAAAGEVLTELHVFLNDKNVAVSVDVFSVLCGCGGRFPV